MYNTKLQVLRYKGNKIEKYRITCANFDVFGTSEEWKMYLANRREILKKKFKLNIDKPKISIIYDDSIKRARDQIFNLVVMNDFKYFVTITIDRNRTLFKDGFSASDLNLVSKKMMNWLRNQAYRKGLQYIIIPEYHVDGESVHFHGLINDSLTLTDSGTIIHPDFKKPVKPETVKRKGLSTFGCKTVYNIKDWKYGITTAIELDEQVERIAGYVTKYITKDCKKIFGKYFWSSRNIKHTPDVSYHCSSFDKMPEQEYTCSFTSTKFKYRSNIFITEEQEKIMEDEIFNRSRHIVGLRQDKFTLQAVFDGYNERQKRLAEEHERLQNLKEQRQFKLEQENAIRKFEKRQLKFY